MKKIISVAIAVLMVFACLIPACAKAESDAFLTSAIHSGAIYAQQMNTILVRTTDDNGNVLKTIGELTGYLFGTAKDYNYFYTFVVEKQGDNWRVTAANNTLALGAENAQKDREVPEGGFIIGVQGTSEFIGTSKEIVVGDYVVLTGVDLEELSAFANGQDFTSAASVAFYHDDGTPDEESKAPVEESKAPAEESKTDNAETGDGFVLYVLAALIACAGVTVAVKSRK